MFLTLTLQRRGCTVSGRATRALDDFARKTARRISAPDSSKTVMPLRGNPDTPNLLAPIDGPY